jgi:plasmid stabilization system protein ParE
LTRQVRVHPAAAEEAEAAVAWYEHEREGLGRALKDDFDNAAARLASGSEDGMPVRGRAAASGARRLILARFHYDIVFLLDGADVTIVAYAHHARRPGYWRDRWPA